MSHPAPASSFTTTAPAPPCPPVGPRALSDVALGLARTAHLLFDRIDQTAPQRTGVRLLATGTYDAWLLHWPAGTRVTPHDHGGSAGAFTVVTGQLTETRWHRRLRRTRLTTPGEVVTIDPTTVHDVAAGPAAAISVHVYSPPLSSMGYYDETGVTCLDRAPVEEGDGIDPYAVARALHPARG